MKWDHHGCSLRDWMRASPDSVMSRLPSRPREAAVDETADTCPTSSRITAPPPLTCSVRFTQADLGDAARVTLRSSPLQHTVLLQPIRWCHGEKKTATRDWKGRSPSAKVTGIKRWCGLNVVGVLQLQLLVPEKQQRWGNPLRAQHHGAFRCCSQNQQR